MDRKYYLWFKGQNGVKYVSRISLVYEGTGPNQPVLRWAMGSSSYGKWLRVLLSADEVVQIKKQFVGHPMWRRLEVGREDDA